MKVLKISLLLLILFSLTTTICYGRTAENYNDKGLAYYDKGMYDKAIAECKKALEINPNSAIAHNNLGVTYHRKGMLDEAIAEFKKAIEINPKYAYAYNNLGLAYADQGKLDKAIAQYRKAIEIDPKYAYAYNNLGPINGVVIGVVTQVRKGEVKVKFPWLHERKDEEKESNWARIATAMAGNDRGTFLMPEVNDEVWVEFEHGDVNFPIVTGFFWSGKDKPPENDTK